MGDLLSNQQDIFLISNHCPGKWDFSRLTTATLEALPRCQRASLTMTLTRFSTNIVKEKVDILKGTSYMDGCYSGCCSCSGSASRIVHSSWFRADFIWNQSLQIPALSSKPRNEWFSQPKRRHPRPNSWCVYKMDETALCFPGTICPKIGHPGRCPLCPTDRFGYRRWIIICCHIFRSQRLFAKSWRSISGRHKRICQKRIRRFG